MSVCKRMLGEHAHKYTLLYKGVQVLDEIILSYYRHIMHTYDHLGFNYSVINQLKGYIEHCMKTDAIPFFQINPFILLFERGVTFATFRVIFSTKIIFNGYRHRLITV